MPFAKMSRYSPMLFLWLLMFSVRVYAAGPGVTSDDILDNVLQRFSTVAGTWGTLITARATWLFWLLVVISMVWTFGFMALRRADLGEFFAEFTKFTIFTGFFFWLLVHGPRFATDIMMSLRMVAAQASGQPGALAPSGIVDIGFDIFNKVVDQSTLWKPMDSLFGLLLSMAILVVFALVGVNMLLLLVSGWIFAYAGIFILGFGGSRWTSDLAIGYFKSVLNIGLQLMTMVLLVGVGKSFVDQYYASMSAKMTLQELAVMAVVAVVLLGLVAKLPRQIGALAGGTTGELGSNFGIGAAIGAGALGTAAVASAGASLVAGAASAAGGTQALMAAFSKASAAESAGGGADTTAMMTAASGGDAGAGGGGDVLASAIGDSLGGGDGGRGRSSGSDFGSVDGAGRESAGKGADSEPGSSAGAKPRGPLAAAGALAAKASRLAGGTAVNLAHGSYDVAKEAAAGLNERTRERIGETTGGKIAAAIIARESAVVSGGDAPQFNDDSLSASSQSAEAQAEIASFRDKNPE
jgi:type IV secretion system protein TrbL